MERKYGIFLRTNEGIKTNFGEFYEPSCDVGIGVMPEVYGIWIDKDRKNYIEQKTVVKSSENIIDLIEIGDYVNGLPVRSVAGTRFDENDKRVWLNVATYGGENEERPYDLLFRNIHPKDIKSIVTKEYFEQGKYEV